MRTTVEGLAPSRFAEAESKADVLFQKVQQKLISERTSWSAVRAQGTKCSDGTWLPRIARNATGISQYWIPADVLSQHFPH
ncbi:hypothetical protein KIN20_009074 [Parelaphostrongylus tenuis]|uniref:Uncharacterized protein n=1 Tax=Parelaphostrongylus tenuis TaxID=148309 RepID=A0AAD5M8Y0_PARTN|nr:hypothetical protein KIN20_009074 [Parelaphostrongylus tenuis]